MYLYILLNNVYIHRNLVKLLRYVSWNGGRTSLSAKSLDKIWTIFYSCALEPGRFGGTFIATLTPTALFASPTSGCYTYEEATINTMIAWNIWKWRNILTFNGVAEPLSLVVRRCIEGIRLWAYYCNTTSSSFLLNYWCNGYDPT
jgi:hypothetical protein